MEIKQLEAAQDLLARIDNLKVLKMLLLDQKSLEIEYSFNLGNHNTKNRLDLRGGRICDQIKNKTDIKGIIRFIDGQILKLQTEISKI